MAVTILVGDSRAVLATLPEKSVQLCVTSPPYFGLRSYSTNPQLWGGEQSGACEHAWDEYTERREAGTGGNWTQAENGIGLATGRPQTRFKGDAVAARKAEVVTVEAAHCLRCGCWRGELGSEPTPEAFIANLVEVFGAVKRVLRDDGLLFCNLGDSYAGSGKGGNAGPSSIHPKDTPGMRQGFNGHFTAGDLPAKSLLMMPARVALALQQDGWILRSCMPWIKASAMPESVQDRPSSALEYVFMFSKKARYFYDAEAVRQTAEYGRRSAFRSPQYEHNRSHENGAREHEYIAIGGADPSAGRAFRNTDLFRIALAARIVALRAEVARLEAQRDAGGLLLDEDGDPLALDVNPAAFKDAHFATFPEKLVLPLIKAGTSERGACPTCGTAWVRVTKVSERYQAILDGNKETPMNSSSRRRQAAEIGNAFTNPRHGLKRETETLAWRQSCPCPPAERIAPRLVEPLIKAGTSEKGACGTCGAAWVRVVERGERLLLGTNKRPEKGKHEVNEAAAHAYYREESPMIPSAAYVREQRGWSPSCPCPPEPVPCVVMDIFSGAGTTGLVASRLGRDYIGIELSPVYAAMSESRIRDDAPLLVDVVTAGAVEYAPLELFGERPT